MVGDTLQQTKLPCNSSTECNRRGRVQELPQKYEVCVDICDYKPKDIMIELVDENKAIKVKGWYDAEAQSYVPRHQDLSGGRSRTFSEKYPIPSTANLSTMTHEFLTDQPRLIITMMKKGYEDKDGNHSISGHRFSGSNHKLYASPISGQRFNGNNSTLCTSSNMNFAVPKTQTYDVTSLRTFDAMNKGAYGKGNYGGYGVAEATSSDGALAAYTGNVSTGPTSLAPLPLSSHSTVSPAGQTSTNWLSQNSSSSSSNWSTTSGAKQASKKFEVNPYMFNIPGALTEKYKRIAKEAESGDSEKPIFFERKN